MYENQTYEVILQRALDRVSTDVDKREGSVIMNAIAPVSAEHTNLYIILDNVIKNGYADTAIREYLILRCKERGIVPSEATYAVLKGKFNMEIPIGSRFSLNELNYVAIEALEKGEDDEEGYFYYQMKCESTGTLGNKFFGELSSIEYIHKDLEGELVGLLIPAEDEEDTEALRKRYFDSFDTSPFGGNKKEYQRKTNALEGVGATVVIPIWDGGGTVKLIIVDSNYNEASDVLVERVQEEIDPAPHGTGAGIAPIGHTVTVESAKRVDIAIACNISFHENYSWDKLQGNIISVIEDYFLEMRKAWETGERIVRIAQIETRILGVTGVLDITGTTLSRLEGVFTDGNIELETNELPFLRGITNG